MITVLVGEENGIQGFRGNTQGLYSVADLPRAEADVDQYPAILCRDKSTVSATTTSENRELEHSVLHIADLRVCQARVFEKTQYFVFLRIGTSICSVNRRERSHQIGRA